jgi:DeoR/GlpR family transcriptional regulator of sugar metabolism
MKYHNIRQEILKFVKENRVVTTSELASHFKISWNTADKYMLELVIEGKVDRLKKAGVNLWLLK